METAVRPVHDGRSRTRRWPAEQKLAQGGRIDIYRIDPNAHSVAARRTAIGSHVLLSSMTYGLWEFIGIPLELAVKGRFLTYVLTYDGTEKLARLETVKAWNPPTITDGDRKKCEQFAAFQAMDVSVPPESAGSAISALAFSFATSKAREQMYYRVVHQCFVRIHAERSAEEMAGL